MHSSPDKGAITKHRVKPYEKIRSGKKVGLNYNEFILPPTPPASGKVHQLFKKKGIVVLFNQR